MQRLDKRHTNVDATSLYNRQLTAGKGFMGMDTIAGEITLISCYCLSSGKGSTLKGNAFQKA